ncbi:MAG: helix-turn-helix transcriptional regulator, partial [Victivallaceae bacterium]|nr:helix-turn-helix transcriptional regulator [Victivallaceae bacterium]
CLNRDYLNRLFRRSTGMTLSEEICRCRLEHACNLLENSTQSVKEIADACGFLDQAYFHRRFLAAKAMTPRRYRYFHSVEHRN